MLKHGTLPSERQTLSSNHCNLLHCWELLSSTCKPLSTAATSQFCICARTITAIIVHIIISEDAAHKTFQTAV